MKVTFSILLLLGGTNAFAKDDCAKCAEMKQLENEFNALNYFNSADNDTGNGKSVKALEIAEDLTKDGSKLKPDEFQGLVMLVGAANIYDAETASASALAAYIGKSKTRQAAFEKALPQITESCRRKELQNDVEEFRCQFAKEKKGAKHSQDQDPGNCIKKPIFNVEDCLRDAANSKK